MFRRQKVVSSLFSGNINNDIAAFLCSQYTEQYDKEKRTPHLYRKEQSVSIPFLGKGEMPNDL